MEGPVKALELVEHLQDQWDRVILEIIIDSKYSPMAADVMSSLRRYREFAMNVVARISMEYGSEKAGRVLGERTGWRPMEMSLRHRQWGHQYPAIDIDFLVCEYDRGRVSALVEYKHEQAGTFRIGHPSYKALIGLGDSASLPVFVCRYAADFSWWLVTPINGVAKSFIRTPNVKLTEREWLKLLDDLRTAPRDKSRPRRWTI
jgi:hypothetical protein